MKNFIKDILSDKVLFIVFLLCHLYPTIVVIYGVAHIPELLREQDREIVELRTLSQSEKIEYCHAKRAVWQGSIGDGGKYTKCTRF